MSRSLHHATKHGPLAFGRGFKQRAYGYEFWSRRPYSGIGSGRWLKMMCHRQERRDADRQILREVKDAA